MKLKVILFIFSILFFIPIINAQNIERVLIKGKVSVDIPEVEGITIYNATTRNGVITNANGEFEIKVAENDRLDISALLYQNFSVQITNEDIEKRTITIYLIELVNNLDEVVVLRYGLSGFIKEDIKKVKVFNPQMPSINLDDYSDLVLPDDQFSAATNIITRQGTYYNMVDGRELIKLISKLFQRKNKFDKQPTEVNTTLEEKYENNFYIESFNIPEDKIQAFLVFVKGEAFDTQLLLPENEMKLIELLNTKSTLFLAQK